MDTSKQLSVEEGNRLIMFFDGAEEVEFDLMYLPAKGIRYKESYYPEWNLPKFNENWNLLMPVWVKFVSEYHRLGNSGIYHPTRKIRSEFHDGIDKGEILKSFNAIVQGIQWYQSNKQL